MKLFSQTIILLIITGLFNFMCASRCNAQASGGIRIVQGGRDTVHTSEHTIIGTVAPGSSVTINGQPVKVYKTGSFGYKFHLQNGYNSIAIEYTDNNGGIQTKNLRIYYDPSAKQRPTRPEAGPSAIKDTSLIIKTLPGAYLNYGNGSDRLGGAKINFLDKDILLKVTGASDNLYRIRLSDNRYAFIPKECAERVTEEAQMSTAPCLSGSWSVSNTGKGTDRVSVSLETRKPYIVREETQPHRLMLDLYGVQCNSNWITQYPGLESIRDVQFEQTDSDVLRIIIHLKHKTSWGYAVKYEGNHLIVDVRHLPEKFSLSKLTIGVDAGHGGSSSGAVSPAGYKEKDQTLAMAYILTKMLQSKGARTVMSRTDDSDVSMAQRKEIFKENGIDLLVSIHCNAGGDPLTTGGTSTYYKHWTYRELANSILQNLLKIEGVKCFGMVGNFNFSLNAPTEYPSVLVETLFMSNLWDEEHITDVHSQEKLMKKVVKGLEDYLKLCTKVERKHSGPDGF